MATPFDARMQEIQRRRQIAEALMRQSMQPQGPVSAGRFVVGPTPFASASGLAAAIMGARGINKADQEANDAMAQERARLAEAFGRMVQSEGGQGGISPTQQRALEIISGLPLDQQRELLAKQSIASLFPKLSEVNLGDRVVLRDERGNIRGEFERGVSPDARFREQGAMARHQTPSGSAQLSAETQRRGQDLTAHVAMRGQDVTMRGQDLTDRQQQQRFDLDRRKFEAERGAEQVAKARAQKSTALALDRGIKNVDDAIELVNWRTTGAIGAATSEILPSQAAGTDRYSLVKAIETIQANLGFRELERMKAESATGASGLGQLTEREFDRLAATLANLDPNQSEDRLLAQLNAVREHLVNLQKLNEAAQALEAGRNQSGATGRWNTGDAELDDALSRYLPQGGQ